MSTNPYYNPGGNIAAHTVARAADVVAELQQIKAGFAKLPAPSGIADTGGQPNYTHIAFADSADGSQNFTTGEPENRAYVGFYVNQSTPTPSDNPADYSWIRTQGIGATYVEERYIRSRFQPDRPDYGDDPPAGSLSSVPPGSEALWSTRATRQANGTFTTPWSEYERISGPRSPVPYVNTDTYYIQEQVFFGGGTYILIVAESVGNPPSGTAQNNAFWAVVSAPGETGAPASPPSGFTATIDLASATGANLRTLADAAGYTGLSDATITFRVPNNANITGAENGGIGIDSGTWPSADYTIALTLVIQSGGIVRGGGGKGGTGGPGGNGTVGGNGSPGGDAIYLRENFTGGITVNSGGNLQAGGGGGGGGGSGGGNAQGGGGGGGAPNGPKGLKGGVGAQDGEPGWIGGGGSGGSGEYNINGSGLLGRPGGNFGVAGQAGDGTTARPGGSGGAAGFAVRKNGKTATVTNNGTLAGSVA